MPIARQRNFAVEVNVSLKGNRVSGPPLALKK
jgi:hypothetical protein